MNQFDVKENALILLAEDSDDDAFFIERAFRKARLVNPLYRVTDGEEAIAYLDGKNLRREGQYANVEEFPLPRFLLLDLKMPRKTGFDVLDWLRLHPECRVVPTIAFSSSSLASDINKAYELGVNTYFTKPNDFDEMKLIFQTIMLYWNKANIPPIPESQRCV